MNEQHYYRGEKQNLSTRRNAGGFRYHQGLKEDSIEFDEEVDAIQCEDQKDTLEVIGDQSQAVRASRVP
jgi:hypothetical protein